jgi:hypothetical protein
VRTTVTLLLAAAGEVVDPPVWDMTDVIFEQGVAAALDLRTRARDPAGRPMTFTEIAPLNPALVGPFQWDSASFVLSYDGRSVGLAEGDKPKLIDSGIRIAADNGG